jgi:hypothetical protein
MPMHARGRFCQHVGVLTVCEPPVDTASVVLMLGVEC